MFVHNPQRTTPACHPLTQEIHSLVPTQLPSVLATPDLDETVTHVTIDVDRVQTDSIEYELPASVTLGHGDCFPYTPPSKDLFGYAQKRSVLAFNASRKVGLWHLVCPRLEETIRAVHLLDAASFTLLLDIKITGEPGTHQRLLRTVPMGNLLEGIEVDLALGPWPDNYTAPVTTHRGTVIHYDLPARAIRAYTAALTPGDHPLVKLYDDNRERIRLPVEIAVHPTLPFAAIIDRNPLRNQHYAVHIASWHPDEPGVAPVPSLINSKLYCSALEFSPDGRWMVLRDESADSDEPEFVALPIARDKPPFLGPPVSLGKLHNGPPLSTCWCGGPQRFVATDGSSLYVWEL